MKCCFFVIAAALLGFVSCTNPLEEDPAPGAPIKTLVCFGDSLTAGFGASVPGIDDKSKSYPAFLQNKVAIDVVNSGWTGITTAQAKTRVYSDVVSKNPKIVIIELGANDLLTIESIGDLNIAATKSNLEYILDAVKSTGAKIYLAKFYTPQVAHDMCTDYFGTLLGALAENVLINQYDPMFSQLAQNYGAELIPNIWTGIWGVHMSDQIHPNAAGYQIMADNYFNAITSYLQSEGLLY